MRVDTFFQRYNLISFFCIPDLIVFLYKKLKRTTHIRFLVITTEENLTWSHNINVVINKLKGLFHIFYNIRDYLTKENIKTMYCTMIYSRMKYGITIHGNKLNKIQVLKNPLLKVLLKIDYRSPTDEIHKSMDILKINNIAEQKIVTFVRNYFINNLPPVFNDYYETFCK